jgi:hypothetical protein
MFSLIFSAVQRQQRKSDVMTSFGLTACSAVYYHAGSSIDTELEVSVVSPRLLGGAKMQAYIRRQTAEGFGRNGSSTRDNKN